MSLIIREDTTEIKVGKTFKSLLTETFSAANTIVSASKVAIVAGVVMLAEEENLDTIYDPTTGKVSFSQGQNKF